MVNEETVNLLDMLKDVDVDKVGSVLKEFEKYEKLLDKVSGIVMRLNRIGVLPAVLRIAGAKTGVQNLNEPLPKPSELSIEAASPTHLLVFKELNKQSEQLLTEMFKRGVLAEAKHAKRVGKSKDKDRKG